MSGAEHTPDNTGGKEISPGKRRRLQQCFEYGRANFVKGDYKYAADMFTQCLLGDPGNQVYAQNFLETLHKQYNNNKKGGTFAGLKGAGSKSALKKAQAKQDWDAAVKAAVDLLRLNPWDAQTLIAMAKVSEQYASDECQLYFLKMALDTNPKDPEINRLAAMALARIGQFDQAIVCWHRVEQAKPDDEEATKMISQLTVEKTLFHGSRPVSAGSRSTKTKDQQAEAEQDEDREPTVEERLLAKVAQAPHDVSNYVDLAECYAQQDRFDKAGEICEQALAIAGPGDMRLRERQEDYRIRYIRKQLETAEHVAEQQKTEDAISLAKRMRAELNQTELEIYAARCDRNPANDAARYELGVRLKRAGKFKEAIQHLQQARGDSKRKAAVHLELGECFQYIEQFPLAMTNYEQAIQSSSDKDLETLKLALYRAGRLAMGLKDLQAAEEHLTKLAGLDFAYKDVAHRLDKLTQLRHKG